MMTFPRQSTDSDRAVPAPSWKTLADLGRHWAAVRPSSTAFVWLDSRGVEAAGMTYAELDRRARCVGARLTEEQLAGKAVLLLYGPGLGFITAFLGCAYAGAIAVTAYPPHPREGVERVARIMQDCDARVVLTESGGAERVRGMLEGHPVAAGRLIITTDTLPPELGHGWVPRQVDSQSIAFLQYTSGSTGVPKGVQVSHANILANQEMIRTAFGHTNRTVFVGWLPLHHDMGLVGNVLQPLYLGIPSVLMAPEAFTQKPVRWLSAISRYQATTSGGPNFAYELCARRVSDEELATLDLSSWDVAFNGAEPIRADTLERFARRFERCGFRRQTMYPCYGMAETTLFVTGGLADAEPIVLHVDARELESHRVVPCEPSHVHARAIVGCGRAWCAEQVLVVDPETRTPCGPDQVGEVCVRGPHVSHGYWNREEVNRETFNAYLASGEGPFLRTGDLGFLHGEELFITGRLKDLIILNGRNLYPQDIERTVGGAHPAFRPGGTAAITLEVEGVEQLAIVQEISRRHRGAFSPEGEALRTEMLRAVRRAVSDVHEASIHGCVFVGEYQIPKTSSGKTRRRVCVELYRSGGQARIGNAWTESAGQGADS